MKPHAITGYNVKLVLGERETVEFSINGHELPDEEAITTVAQLAAAVITSPDAEVLARAFLFQLMAIHSMPELPDAMKEQAAAWTAASDAAEGSSDHRIRPVFVAGKPGGEPN